VSLFAPAAASETVARTPTDDVRDGVRAMTVVAVGYLPFGLLVGAAVSASDQSLAAWLSTWTIYGGAAQLAVLDVLDGGAGWMAAAGVGLLVNVRLTAYATAMAPQWRHQPVRMRALAALVLTDAVWAMARAHRGDDAAQRRYYLGAALTLLVAWPTFVTVGVGLGSWFDAVPGADLLPALTLGTLAVHQLRDRPTRAAVLAACTAALVTATLPSGLGLAACALAAAAAGNAVSGTRLSRTGSS
jgi:predicted branched-subunit amino acid permease